VQFDRDIGIDRRCWNPTGGAGHDAHGAHVGRAGSVLFRIGRAHRLATVCSPTYPPHSPYGNSCSDRFRTAVNVHGDAYAAAMVERLCLRTLTDQTKHDAQQDIELNNHIQPTTCDTQM
jgi:hypothetical protein